MLGEFILGNQEKFIFNSFSEYWYYTRALSENQRKIIFRSLPTEQKSFLDNSYCRDGWNDVFYRNEIDEEIDKLKQKYGYNLIDIRIKAIKGNSVYLPSKFWEEVMLKMGKYRKDSIDFVMSGMKGEACEENPAVCLVVFKGSVSKDQ